MNFQPHCRRIPQTHSRFYRSRGPFILITLIVICVIALPLGEQNSSPIIGVEFSNGNLVWSETFDTADEWELQGFDLNPGENVFTWKPKYTPRIEKGTLKMLNTQAGWHYSQAVHTSTVAYGTWSFDWYVNTGEDHQAYDVVFFIANNYIPTEQSGEAPLNSTAYALALTSGYKEEPETLGILLTPVVALAEWRYGTKHLIFLDYHEFSSPLEGAYHIDITRNITGEFHIYFDQNLVLKVTDKSTTTSESFIFGSWFGDSLFDNLTVSSTVDVHPIPIKTRTFSPPLIEIMVSIGVIVILRKKTRF